MTSARRLPIPDPRRASRFSVEFDIVCETRQHGEFPAKMTNISAHGCRLVHEVPLAKGDRVEVRLPVAGRLEAFLIWSHGGRSGFEFERVIREEDFLTMLDQLPQV